jgi:hypothetical protein
MINVDAKWVEIRDLLKRLHQERVALVQELTEMAKAFQSGPKPGVNYEEMSGRTLQITARMEELNKAMFTVAQDMFFALVDDARVGADGNLRHLLLTKKDRTSMVQLIDKTFGATLEDEKVSHIVSAAWAIKYGLTQTHYKAADEQ